MNLPTSTPRLNELYQIKEDLKHKFISFVDARFYGEFHHGTAEMKKAEELILLAFKEFDFDQKLVESLDNYFLKTINHSDLIFNKININNLKNWLLVESNKDIIEFFKIRTISNYWTEKIKSSNRDWSMLKEYNECIYEDYLLALYESKISTFSVDRKFRKIAISEKFNFYKEILSKYGFNEYNQYGTAICQYLDDEVMQELDYENGFLEEKTY